MTKPILIPVPRHPRIIQGGMGVAVSNWCLARTVSQLGQLGVVSGTGLDSVLVRRLQDGDIGGHVRRALAQFPFPELVKPVLEKYFRPEGRAAHEPYKLAPMHVGFDTVRSGVLSVLGGFVEVWLAKAGHAGQIGVNLLTKIQTHTLPTLYGTLLAGVDYVLMGAGIPREIPEVLDKLSQGLKASLKFDVTGATAQDSFRLEFDPAKLRNAPPVLNRPNFLPIIASNLLATMLARKSTGAINGFIVEAPTAGGHNAPPRGELTLDALGQPVYGERDVVNLEQLRDLGYPFWLAGGTGSPEALEQALENGAVGIQVGTLFAYSQESGFTADLKRAVLQSVQDHTARIFTDPRASPTGFPFKVVQLPGSLSDQSVYEQRERICDLGYLREPYRTEKGGIGFRCSAAPVAAYVQKGGNLEDTTGRKCLCNSLMASVGHPQVHKESTEPALITSGDELLNLGGFLSRYGTEYTASDVISYLLRQPQAS